MLPTNPARATHDYERNGTVDLFAAFHMARGTVISDIRASHDQKEFIAFLNKINRKVPVELGVHIILHNLFTHAPTRHPRCSAGSCGTGASPPTPTHGSWMNMEERWFFALITKKLQLRR
jgi:DDE superfamily endonuclease